MDYRDIIAGPPPGCRVDKSGRKKQPSLANLGLVRDGDTIRGRNGCRTTDNAASAECLSHAFVSVARAARQASDSRRRHHVAGRDLGSRSCKWGRCSPGRDSDGASCVERARTLDRKGDHRRTFDAITPSARRRRFEGGSICRPDRVSHVSFEEQEPRWPKGKRRRVVFTYCRLDLEARRFGLRPANNPRRTPFANQLFGGAPRCRR